MNRLITETPSSGLEFCLNMFYAKDGETWVRGYGENNEDISLCDLIRKIAKEHKIEIAPDAGNRDIDQLACDWLSDGVSSIEGIAALIHTAAWVSAELRSTLKTYEEDSYNAVIIKHTPNGSKFLFAVPYDIDLKEGDAVLVNTKKGEDTGICQCDSFRVKKSTLEVIGGLTGAKFPLSWVVGRYNLVRFGIDE